VTGQTAILATATIRAYVMGSDTSSDHDASDHEYFPALAGLSAGTATAATGFTIYARSTEKLTGTWTVRYAWTNP
jgi:hypothetical protein